LFDGPRQLAGREYSALRASVEKGNTAKPLLAAEAAIEAAKQKPPQKFSYDRLKQRPLPDTTDPANLEIHLVDVDFPKAFSMTHAEFMALPKWKRDEKKRAIGLF
jgi:hypothetical protein